jgi:hypothetical protein
MKRPREPGSLRPLAFPTLVATVATNASTVAEMRDET